MAGIKISALPAIPSSLLTDIAPFVQGGITYKASNSQIISLFNNNIQLSSAAQVTGLPATLASFLPLSGGTMTGDLFLNTNSPSTNLQAASKGYVDTVASGFTVVLACAAATTANLNATPAGAGVGATLTNAGAMAAFAVDGYSAALNDRILVKNQTLSQHNGIYTVTTVGSGAVNWVLTRATDYDQAPAEIKPGTLVAVNNGTTNANTSWLETATVVTVDTDPILFSQFTFAPTAFLMVANNLSDVANAATSRTNLGLTGAATMALPVSTANGGTGVSNSNTITLGGNILTAGALTLAGAFASTFTFTNTTSVTFPTSGTLITSSQPTINQPNIVGTTTNDNAAAGSVGEFVSSVINYASALACTNGIARNVTSINLSAGDWDVWGNVAFNITGTTSAISGWVSSTSATMPDKSLLAWRGDVSGGVGIFSGMAVPQLRFSLNALTTIYLSGSSNFTTGSTSICGGIYARRVR